MKLLTGVLLFCVIAAGCTSTQSGVYQNAVKAFNEIKKGDDAVKKGDIDTALKHYEKSLELAPEAPKHRFAYAQLLYWKGLTFAQESHRKWARTEGWTLDDQVNEWQKTDAMISEAEKQLMLKKSAEWRREGLIYFTKAIRELELCDAAWGYAVEAVPYAKAITFVFMDRFDEAVREFNRVLESQRVRDDIRQKIQSVIRHIRKYQQDLAKQGRTMDESAP
jgi:tetratricopeptide (TPR) repeat protein